MSWRPTTESELKTITTRELARCSDELRAYYASVACEPVKWQQSPYGSEGGGFWVIAVDQDRVLWYNDIEDGFNVSVFVSWGTIPTDEYWCNQDELQSALPALQGLWMGKASPPRPGEFDPT